MWEMIKAEFRHIRRNRLLLLSFIVICFIPFLYSIFFLKSVWDRTGAPKTYQLPWSTRITPLSTRGKP